MSNRIAVIGIGNILRRDDGIGIKILESLLKFYKKDGVDYFNFGTASFDLMHRMQSYDEVILIDAINAALASGEVRFFELKDIKYNIKESAISTHELNLTGIFELSRKFKLKTKIYVAGIQAEDISWAEGLSESLKAKKKDIVKQVSAFIDKTLKIRQGAEKVIKKKKIISI